MMTPIRDLVVVGAGIGGLTAAALAARDGLETLVLEAHNRPGGCAGDFALDGVLFPAGATLISGFEPGGLHRWVYDRLGIRDRATPLDRAMEIVGTEGRCSLWADRDRWRAELTRAFPATAAAATRFFEWAEKIGGVVHRMAGRLPVLPPRTPGDVLRLARASRPEVLRTLPLLRRTAADVLASFGADGDASLRQFVDAQLLDAAGCEAADCAAVSAAIALDLYHRGCFGLPGGPAEIARDLLRALRRMGGSVRFQTAVIGLRRDTSGVWQVRTAEGDIVRARAVVCNVPVWDVPALMGEQTPRRLRSAGRLRAHGWGAVVLHAAVDPSALPAAEHAHYQTLPPVGEPLSEGGMCFITVSLPGGRPGAPRAVSASTHTNVGRWWGLDTDGYHAQKERYREVLLQACERALPGFRDGLRFARLATPRTFAHYTLRGRGLVGGLRMDVRHALFGSVSHHSGAPGLFLCGDTVFPGQGTIGVTLSGINAWRSVRDSLGLSAWRAWVPWRPEAMSEDRPRRTIRAESPRAASSV